MSILVYSAIEMAAAKAAQHRLMRGVWTNVRFGDMRRALAGAAFSPQQLLMYHGSSVPGQFHILYFFGFSL
jgi:hypothetical protein